MFSPTSCSPSTGVSGPAGNGRYVIPSLDSIPVERSSVSARAWARVLPSTSRTSTSSYSLSPSWHTVRPPARTKRRDGKVGRPYSSARPSASRPRRTVAKAHSASDSAAGIGSGRWTRSRWSRLGLTKEWRIGEHRVVGMELEACVHVDELLAGPLPRSARPPGPATGTWRCTSPRRAPGPTRRPPPTPTRGARPPCRGGAGSSCTSRRGPRRRRAARSPPARPPRRCRRKGRRRRSRGRCSAAHRPAPPSAAPVVLAVTGCSRATGVKRSQPKPGTLATRATTRRIGGWSSRTRTGMSGRAPKRV